MASHLVDAQELQKPPDADDVLFVVTEDYPPLLPPEVTEVEAQCVAISRARFSEFKTEQERDDDKRRDKPAANRLIFAFLVKAPYEHHNEKLYMYVRLNPQWKKPPVRSKLLKILLAIEERPVKGLLITRSMFLRKMFRCRVKAVQTKGRPYTVIETITKKLTG